MLSLGSVKLMGALQFPARDIYTALRQIAINSGGHSNDQHPGVCPQPPRLGGQLSLCSQKQHVGFKGTFVSINCTWLSDKVYMLNSTFYFRELILWI